MERPGDVALHDPSAKDTKSSYTDFSKGGVLGLLKDNRRQLELFIAMFIVIGMPIYLGVPLSKNHDMFKCMFIISIPLCVFIGGAEAANDACNAIGSSYAAKILTMNQALCISVVFEVIGCMVMGTHVTKTITRGIVDPANYVDTPEYYVLAMPAVLAGASLVAISCTIYGLPVSMSKGTIFGLVSVGLASIGTVAYKGVIKCVIGLIVSPLLGGLISCILHLILIITVKKKDDPVRAAKIVQPIAGGFAVFILITFILYKGIKIKPFWMDILIGLACGVVTMIVLFAILRNRDFQNYTKANNTVAQSPHQQDGEVDLYEPAEKLKPAIKVFEPLVVLAACFMAFAHGGNDVGNAVGPMVAVYAVQNNNNEIPEKIDIPMNLLGIGAAAFGVGIILAGSRTTVTWQKITNFDGIKSFSSQIGATFTILFASVLKIPVSGSHISFGAICGAGLAEKIMRIPVKIDTTFVAKIAFVWCIKIPVSMFVAMFMFYEFKGIFTKYDGFGGSEEF